MFHFEVILWETFLQEGVYVRGLFLEGAGWDSKLMCLAEPIPLMLVYPMPIILFRPVEQQKRKPKGNLSFILVSLLRF